MVSNEIKLDEFENKVARKLNSHHGWRKNRFQREVHAVGDGCGNIKNFFCAHRKGETFNTKPAGNVKTRNNHRAIQRRYRLHKESVKNRGTIFFLERKPSECDTLFSNTSIKFCFQRHV